MIDWSFESPLLPGEYLAAWIREDGRLAVTQLLFEPGLKARWTLRSGQPITRVYAWTAVPSAPQPPESFVKAVTPAPKVASIKPDKKSKKALEITPEPVVEEVKTAASMPKRLLKKKG